MFDIIEHRYRSGRFFSANNRLRSLDAVGDTHQQDFAVRVHFGAAWMAAVQTCREPPTKNYLVVAYLSWGP